MNERNVRGIEMTDKRLTPDELQTRAVKFYARYGKEIEQIAELLQIKLKQLAFAYTLNVCWFVDDCYGVLNFIKASNHFDVSNESTHPVKDFVAAPQPAGYRGIHVFADVTYDSVQRVGSEVTLKPKKLLCEIQIRSKLQDAWGDITHEFFYKAKAQGVKNDDLESFLADVSHRLAQEDKTLLKFRDTYQRLTDEKTKQGRREGFRDEN